MSFVQELKRRNVVRVGVLYVVAAWLILQAAELLFDAMNVPSEWLRFLIAILVLGLPLVLVFSWVFELTPEGVKLEKDIDRDASITPQTGQRMNVVITVLLVVAVATVALDRLMPEQAAQPAAAEAEDAIIETGAAENSIAVLPFTDLSADGDQEYFSDGIAEEILNVLVRIDGLEVASRTTSFGFKGQESLGIPVIAAKMSVRHVLEGSVRKSGDTVRITAQLIDAQSDKHLWSETYDRTLSAESIFEIQDEIAGAIVEQLGALMNTTGAGGSGVRAAADTQDLEAYELYLKAHKFFIERSDVEQAIELFELAVGKDPGFARAWAGLAGAYFVAPGWVGGERDYSELTKEAANTAIALNPDLALPYAALGGEFTLRPPLDFEAGLRMFDKALLRDPKETTTILWRGIANMALGYFDRAKKDLVRCLELDPAYDNCRRHLAVVNLYSGDYAEAERLYERGLQNGFIGTTQAFQFYYIARGNNAAVLTELAYLGALNYGADMVDPIFTALSDRNFEFEDVRANVEAVRKAFDGEDVDWSSDGYISFAFRNYIAINHMDQQFWWFPYPADYRQSPQKKAIMRRFGLDQHWRKHGFPPQCWPVGDDDFECEVTVPKTRPSGSGSAPR